MFQDKNLSKYTLSDQSSVLNALKKIEHNAGRIVFIVNETEKVVGVLTNGDIIRWLSKQEQPDMSIPVMNIANTSFKFNRSTDSADDIQQNLNKVLFIPLLDDAGKLVSVARRDQPADAFKIGETLVNAGSPCFVIAEIGNNHNGSLDLAKKLIDETKQAGVDCAKFQMRNMDTLYKNKGNADDSSENLGSQYTLDLLSKFQLSDEELFEAFDYCKAQGMEPLCTPWDQESLKKLEDYGMSAYKVASADFTNHDLLKALAATGKPLICSTGMSTEEEILKSTDLLKSLGAAFILLHCNSTYPAPFKDINLKYMNRLSEITNQVVGYSGHERGIHVSVAAAALGAKIIERHITLDKNMEGNDHKASLLPYEFEQMVIGIKEVEESLGTSGKRMLSQGEMMNRVSLAKSLIINCDLKKGEVVKESMIEVKSPGNGLQPIYKTELIGRTAKHDFSEGDFFYPNDITDEIVQPRPYNFTFPFGIPVRYHDFNKLKEVSNFDLVEFHLSYKDLDLTLSDYLEGTYDMDYVVHAPELFEGDHTLDLCTKDEEYRSRSVKEMQRVIDIALELQPYFERSKKPLIIVNAGGFTSSGFMTEAERTEAYVILEKSLGELNMEGVELIPQTMPPFPWHFGGQQYHNLFVDPDEIADFCARNSFRICLDTSHSKLACNYYNWSFYNFLEKTAKYSAHYHLADSQGTGGEGLQINEGEIDFAMLGKVIKEQSPNSSFIPEIWQGHENDGEGGWIALERLEGFLN